MRPARGSNAAWEHHKNEDFSFIQRQAFFFDIYKETQSQFFSLFQCGPRNLVLSLMRPASPFEFETPDIKVVFDI